MSEHLLSFGRAAFRILCLFIPWSYSRLPKYKYLIIIIYMKEWIKEPKDMTLMFWITSPFNSTYISVTIIVTLKVCHNGPLNVTSNWSLSRLCLNYLHTMLPPKWTYTLWIAYVISDLTTTKHRLVTDHVLLLYLDGYLHHYIVSLSTYRKILWVHHEVLYLSLK